MNFKRIVFCFFMLFLFQIPVFADVINFNSLPEAVSSEDLDKEYSFNGTQTIEVNLGELKGHLLTINGTQNVNSVINSTGTNGITLSTTSSSSQHLVINNVSGFDNFKSAIVNNKSISSVTINNSAFNNNGRSLKGSAVYNLGYIDVNNSTFSLNFSSYGGAVINGDGAVSGIQKSSKANLNNVLFENNTAQTGGAIVNDVNSTIYMNDVSFSSNTAIGRDDKYGGGAIANKGKIIMMKDSSFVDNESNISGGAIENSETLNIYGFTEFTGNKARQNGGAIFNSDYKNIATYTNFVNISSGANFKDNSAKNGGAIDNDGALFLTANTHEITFINNTASNFGGAIYNHIYSTVDLKTTDTNKISFTNNTATGKGGAIYNESGILNLIADTADIEFTDNIANDISNAIHTNGGTINLWTSENADIVFNDRITSEDGTSILNINASTTTVTAKGKISLNEDMRGYTGIVNLYDGQLELQEGNKFFDTDNFTIHGGTFTANANDILKDFTNNGTVNFIGGTNSNSISGNGTTIIDGEVLNNSTIANAITINEGKKLTTGVDAITGVIENNGELLFNSDGTNSNSINGNGTTIIDGEVLNNSTIANAVTINTEKKLTTSASDITGEILNNGTLNFIGGINNNTITGINGILIINDNLENNFAIEQSSITINGVVINNSNISTENMYLDGTFYIGANGSFFTAINSTVYDGSEINLQNNLIQEHNFGNLTIEPGFVNLVVDADLENKQMDTISANDESSINGTINIKALNILTDTKEIKTEVLFTSSTVLQDKISSINTASSKLYKYNVFYNDGYFSFINVRGEINPVIAESAIAASVGGFATQTNILGQVFSSIDTQIMSRNQAKKRSVLYAAASNSVFDIENKIERNLWIRPYAVQETVKFNDIDVDNTAIGTLAGIDLVTSEESLVSFYLGYAGSNQKYEDIKINQTGYVLGATGMLIKEKLYAGLTGNINFNKAESQSDYGTDSFDMNMYSIGAKTGYNFDLSDKFILEPNLTLMYGNVSNQEYETTQGAKIDSQSNTNIVVQPQVKAKFSFENGWQPYGLLGYIANISDKTKVVVDGIEFETGKINGYVEYGAGVNKDFIGTPWNCYLQVTGRNGGRNGFAGNLGIKYKF